MERRVTGLKTDLATIAWNDGPPSMEAVGHKMGQMPEKLEKSYHTRLGTYHGLECGVIVHPSGGTEIYLDGATRSLEQLVRDKPRPACRVECPGAAGDRVRGQHPAPEGGGGAPGRAV